MAASRQRAAASSLKENECCRRETAGSQHGGWYRSMRVPRQHRHPPPTSPPVPASSFLPHYIGFFLTTELLPKGMAVGREHRGRAGRGFGTGWMILVAGKPGKPRKPAEHKRTRTKMSCAALSCASRDFLGAGTGFYKQARGPATYPQAPSKGAWKMTKSSQSNVSAQDHFIFG